MTDYPSPSPMNFTAAGLADRLKGEIEDDGSVLLTGFSVADRARAGDLTIAEKDAYFAAAETSVASAILVSGPFTSTAPRVSPS